jgi:(1->4)-alpha-D-glucan 1-alpha-D-glucosylmutase
VSEGLLAPERLGDFLSEKGDPVYSTKLCDAILTYLARSRARLMLIQLEDVGGEAEQANLPGTTDTHPNWRRGISFTLEELISGVDLPRIAILTQEARRAPRPNDRSTSRAEGDIVVLRAWA